MDEFFTAQIINSLEDDIHNNSITPFDLIMINIITLKDEENNYKTSSTPIEIIESLTHTQKENLSSSLLVAIRYFNPNFIPLNQIQKPFLIEEYLTSIQDFLCLSNTSSILLPECQNEIMNIIIKSELSISQIIKYFQNEMELTFYLPLLHFLKEKELKKNILAIFEEISKKRKGKNITISDIIHNITTSHNTSLITHIKYTSIPPNGINFTQESLPWRSQLERETKFSDEIVPYNIEYCPINSLSTTVPPLPSIQTKTMKRPTYFNIVYMKIEWTPYARAHYSIENPPNPIAKGYHFMINYADNEKTTKEGLPPLSSSSSPKYTLMEDSNDPILFKIIKFIPPNNSPYIDVSFKIRSLPWEKVSQRYTAGIYELEFMLRKD